MHTNHPGELLHPLTYAVSFEVSEKHQHSCWEFTLILRGTAKTYINETLYNVSRGDLFISKPGDWHYFKIADRKNYEHRDLYLSQNRHENGVQCPFGRFIHKNICPSKQSTHAALR